MIKFLDLKAVNSRHEDEIAAAVLGVLRSGRYLQGQAVATFEQQYADFIGTPHCVGVGNGLDALTLIYRAYLELGLMRPGDEVIVPANTFIASILAITENGLKPVLVEPRADTLLLDDRLLQQALTPRTRSLMLVHLYGRCAHTERIADFCRRHQLLLVEDNAQAHGCRAADGRRTGSLGHAAGHSFYPGKNLGAMGDAGAVTTADPLLAQTVRQLANYGQSQKYVCPRPGRNSRLDEVQAAVLSVRLRHLDADNRHRQALAQVYRRHLGHPLVALPAAMPAGQDVCHLFPLLSPRRDQLQRHLADCGIETLIHYPIPPHRQQALGQLAPLSLPTTELLASQELSLPMGPHLTERQAMQVAQAVNSFEG